MMEDTWEREYSKTLNLKWEKQNEREREDETETAREIKVSEGKCKDAEMMSEQERKI